MTNRFLQLSSSVLVRQESFGLLFFSVQNTNLCFIKSGELIQADFLAEGHFEHEFYSCDYRLNKQIKKVLDYLLEKGFICEK